MANSKRDQACPEMIGDAILFFDLAESLESITKAEGEKKTRLLKNFLDRCRQYFKDIHNGSLDSEKSKGDSLYCIVRILLPNDDRGRKAYGFKAPVLGRMFAEILALNKESVDGKKLWFFKNPEKQKAGERNGDFGEAVFSVLKYRMSGTTSVQTVSDLHKILDRVAKKPGVTQEMQASILQQFIRRITPLEGKWLSRILLKSVKLGLNSTQIYNLIHPQAKEMQLKIWNLEKMCQRLSDPSVLVKIDDITLFSHCGPMLCTRMTVVDDGFEADPHEENESPQEKQPTKGRKKDPVTLPTPPFIVETKWDGERFHIHFNGSEFKYFSKKGFDFSETFNETLTPRLRLQLNPEVTSFILDGEMMAWHKINNTFTQKGGQIDVKRMNLNNPNHVPTFVAFDIMYLNGEIVMNQPQTRRSEMVSEVVLNPKQGVVLISEQRLMTTKEQVLEALNEAIDNLEEGLIVKDINSKYQPHIRPVTWLKIKPEYLDDSSVDDLDLLILGASYTDSITKGGRISHFLVGIIDQSGSKEMFYPVAHVGSGKLRNPEMKALVDELLPRCGKTEFSNVVYKGRKGKRPDLFINPKNSIVLQVKASEITFSDSYALRYTLRFPRIVKVRNDKPYNQIMSVEEFHRVRNACGGKLARRTDSKGSAFRKRRKPISEDESSDDEDEPATKRIERNGSDNEYDQRLGPSRSAIGSSFKSSILTLKRSSPKKANVTTSINIFKSKIFCVYGSAPWKSKMESEIKAYGGEIVQNPVKQTFFIVGEKQDNIKVGKAIKCSKYNILKPSWIANCISKSKEIEFVPSDFFQYTEEMGEQFQDKYDEFGDSYIGYVSLDDAKSLVAKAMSKLSSSEDEDESQLSDGNNFDVDTLKKELFPGDEFQKIEQYSFLQTTKIAFRDDADPVLIAKIEFYGATVAVDETAEGVTHVINKNPLSPRKKNHLSAIIVKPQWLEDSINQRKMLDEHPYSN